MPWVDIGSGKPYATGVVQTADATVTPVMTVPVPSGVTWLVRVGVAGRRTTDGAAGAYLIGATVKNVAGAVTVVGQTNVAVGEDAGIAAAWSVDLAASGSSVLCRVTGGVADSVAWSGTLYLEAQV